MSEETQRIYQRVEEIVQGGVHFDSIGRNQGGRRLSNPKAIGTLYRYDSDDMTIYELTLLMDPCYVKLMEEHMQPVSTDQGLENIDPNLTQEVNGLVLLCSGSRFGIHATEQRCRRFFMHTKNYQISGQLPHDSFTSAVVKKTEVVYPVSEDG